jgi:hypothetical protein
MEFEQQIIIRFPYREHTEPRDIHARLSAHFGDAAHSLRTSSVGASTFDKVMSCWMMNLGQEDRQLIFSIQIISSLEIQPFHSAYSLTKILDVSHTMILNNLRDSLGMKLFRLHWISIRLTEQLRASRIQKCQELLPLLERMEANKFPTFSSVMRAGLCLSISTA